MSGGFDPVALLQSLTEYGVDFVVIGGFAAWIHGAPIVTMDLDLVYDSNDANVRALVQSLESLDARYRGHGDRILRPQVTTLLSVQSAGHHLFQTRFGNLDMMRTVADQGYPDIEKNSEWFEISGVRCRLATLHKVIELKKAANRPKDRAALPTLLAALKDSES